MGLKKHENEDRFSLTFTLQSFEGRNAILQNSDPTLGLMKWPITKLPEDIREGEEVTLKIADNEEDYLVKRRLLEELVN
ncbi:MAG: hypothetical protein ABH856_03215 [Patescibacteria group bacterium]|nr:hypothetical protein [Patescibacteria group bacterium]